MPAATTGTMLSDAFVRIRPDTQNFGDELGKQVTEGGRKAAPKSKKAGEKVGEDVVKGSEPALKGLAKAVADQVRKAAAGAAGAGKKTGDKLGEKVVEGVKDQAGEIKGVLTAAIAGAGISEAIGQSLERVGSQADLAARLGLDPAAQAKAGKLAGQIYAQNYGDSLDDVNDAVVRVAQDIGLSLGDVDFGPVTKKVLTLASTMKEDVGGVTSAVSQLMRTGLVKDAGQALDVITAGFQAGDDKAGDLLDTVNEYSTQFRKVGLDAGTALGLMSQGLRAGARDSDIVADAIKEFSIRAIDGSTSTKAGFAAIGLSADDMAKKIGKGGKSASDGLQLTLDKLRGIKDPVKQSQAAVALFGTQAEDLGAALFALDPSHAVDALGQVGGAADDMGKTLSDNSSAKFEQFKRSLQDNVIGFMNDKAIPAFQKSADFIKRNSDVILPLAAGLLAAAAAFKVISIAVGIFNVVLDANPIVLISVAVIALGAAMVALYQKSETFRNIVQGVIGFVKDHWGLIVSIMLGPLGIVITAVIKNFDTIKSTATTAIKFVVTKMLDFVGFLLDSAAKAFGWVPGLGPKLKGAARDFAKFKDDVNRSLNGMVPRKIITLEIVEKTTVKGSGRGTGETGSRAVRQLATGGRFGPGVLLVGEEGPEILRTTGPGEVYNADQTRRLLSGQSGGSAFPFGGPSAGGVDIDRLSAAVEAATYAGTVRALADGRMRFERRGAEVLAEIVQSGQQRRGRVL